MDGPPQGSSGWQGVSQAEGGGPWGASVTWSNKEGQPVTLEVGWLASKAQAAAARDLLQAWALQEQGQEVTASHLNLDLERYTDVFPTLLAVKTDLEVLGLVRQLNEDGVLASLVADVQQEGEEGAPPADDAPSNGDKAAAGKPSPRKRRAADKKAEQEAAGKAEAAGPGASPPTSPPSRKRPASAAGNGNGNDEAVQQQQEQRQAAAAGEGEGLAGTEAAAEATPAAGGAGAAGDVKSAKKQRTGTHGEGDYQGITWAKGWTCQVHFVRKQLDRVHQSAMDAGRDRQTLHVVGFASAADAAVAADLAMLYRARVSGGAAAPKRYNFPPEVYSSVETRLYACATIREAKDLVKELRDSGAISTLRQGSSAAAAAAAEAEPAGEVGTAAKGRKLGGRGRPKAKAQQQEQQQQQQQEEEEATGVGGGELAAEPAAQAATAVAAVGEAETEAEPAREEPAAAEAAGNAVAHVAVAALAPEPAGPAEGEGNREVEPAPASPRSSKGAGRAGEGAGAGGAGRRPAKGSPAGRSPHKLPKLKLKLGQPKDSPRPRLKVKSPRAGAADAGAEGDEEGREGAAGGEELRDPSKWMFILDTSSSWACQVAMASNKLAKKFSGAVRSEPGRFTVRVTGFSRIEAATAADLGLMYRSHIYGEDVERQALGYNFPYSFYTRQPPGLLKKLLACKTAEDCKEYLAGLRDKGVIARLAEEAAALERSKPAAAQRRGSEGEEEGEEEEEEQRGGGSDGGSGQRMQSPRAAGGSGSARRGDIKSEAAGEAPSKKKRGSEVVGHGIRVYWPLDDEWYPGVIVSYDASTQRHYVRYDDGEEMYMDLLEEQYKLTKRRRITLPPGHEILRADAGNSSSMRRRGAFRSTAPGPSSGGATSPPGSQQQRGQDPLDLDRPATTPGGKRSRAPRALRELRMLQREEPGAGASKAQRVEGQEGGPRGGSAAELELRGSFPQIAGGGEAGRGGGSAATGRLPREEVEWMYSELKYMLHRTPGLADTLAQGFLSRYLQLHEAWRVQYREVKEAFDAGRHDLVREWVWCALEHS